MRQAKKSLFWAIWKFWKISERRSTSRTLKCWNVSLSAQVSPDIAAQLAMNLAPAAKTEWTFAMISPQQNAAVVSWLEANSKRQ